MTVATGTDARRTQAPGLSMVFVARRFEHVRSVLEHLSRQTALDLLEIVLVTEHAETCDAKQALLDRFAWVQLLTIGTIVRIPDAVAHGMRHARAPIVMFAEDHAYAAPDFTARVVAQADGDWVALGPAMHNANPALSLSWAMYFTSYGEWIETTVVGAAPDVPGHNTCYRRDALRRFGDELASLVAPQGGLHRRLRAAGGTLRLDGCLRVYHVNPTRASRALWHRVESGVCAGAVRASDSGWGLLRRSGAVLLVPLQIARHTVWGIRAWRRVRALPRAVDADARRSPAVAAWIVLCAITAGVGEAFGVLLGDRDLAASLAEFELDRTRLRSARDGRTVMA